MQIHKHIPSYPLSNYIKHMVYVKGSSPVPYIKELPEGGINLVIELKDGVVNTVFTESNLDGKYVMKNAWVSGMQTKAILYENNNDSTILSVRFSTGGFYALTKIPITEITHVGVEAELLLGNSFKKLYQSLINTDTANQKFGLIEEYFMQYLSDDNFEISLVKFIDKNIDRPIDWLINKSGYSQKHVIHLVKESTGFSPKYLQRLHRFQNVIKEIQTFKGEIDWASVAYSHNYFDQAHFIKEFSHFTGIRPTEYLKSQIESDKNHLVTDMILQPPSVGSRLK